MNRLQALTELYTSVVQESNLNLALDQVAEVTVKLTGCRHAMVTTVNEATSELEIRTKAPFEPVSPANVSKQDGIVAYVATTGSSVLSGKVKEDSRYQVTYPDTESELAVPVRDLNGRILAVLNVESDRSDAFDEETRIVMSGLAGVVAVILEREAHQRREEALMRVGEATGTAGNEDSLIRQVMQVAEKVLRLQACSIFLLDTITDRFVLRGTIGRLRDEVNLIGYARGEGFTGWVCDTGKPILLDDPQEDPRWRGKYVEFRADEVASFLAVPILSRSESIGAIRALRRKSNSPFYDNRFKSDDQRLLTAIAEQLSIGLESVRSTERTIRSERMVAWGELSAKSSHMIGNRVFALKGDLNELRFQLGESEPSINELWELEQSLSTNVRRIEEILQDFRDFVTATQLSKEVGDVNALVQETVAEVFPRRSEVELSVNLDHTIGKIKFDGKRLRRAVSELIENSISHMETGVLTVQTREISSDELDRTRGSRVARYAEITIADSGPGIPQDKKDLIFQPFYAGRVRGMGLGLSIVKGIVDSHQGLVFECGKEGVGATFVILLPMEE